MTRKDYLREYMKTYRLKNRDKLLKYEKTRNELRAFHKRTAIVLPAVTKEFHRCMKSHCARTDAKAVMIHGSKAWLCPLHEAENIFP